MKFKNLENESLLVDIKEDDNIQQVITKLAEKLSVEYEDIILMYKNVRLDIDKCLTQYNIGYEDFVLVLQNSRKHSRSPVSVKKPSQVLKHVKKIDNDYPQMESEHDLGDILKKKEKSNLSLSLKCVNPNYKAFKFKMEKGKNIDYFLDYLSKQINVPSSNIKVFKDKNLKGAVSDNIDINKIWKSNKFKQKLYYDIIPSVDNLIKQEMLGQGAFGRVYKCVEIGSQKEFALKEFRISQQKSFELLKSEIDILLKIGDHPRIVKVIKKIEKENNLYILMEYAPRGSLGRYCKTVGPLNENKISKYSYQILEALEYLHKKKVLHRDIKGDNILIFEDECLKLCDFGLAKILTDIASADLLNGVAQSNVGTANWMAPEVIREENYGSSADIWSFGATVVEMLTGMPPYNGLSLYQIVYKICQDRKLEYIEPENLSRQLKSFLDSCLQANPRDRPQASELLKHEFVTVVKR